MQTDFGSSSISQKIAAEWLSSGRYENHLSKIREKLKARRDAVMTALDTHLFPYAEWNHPSGGFFIWVKLKPEIQAAELCKKALSRGVLINPGRIYSAQKLQHIRLSFANAPAEDLQKGIAILESIIKDC
jgi:GntR family transcriptional regulator, regulator for abcA and norABC